MFDLAPQPKYIDALRDKVSRVYQTSGCHKVDPNKLTRLALCLTESLRMNPPLLGKLNTNMAWKNLLTNNADAPNRVLLEIITLKDGAVLPEGLWLITPAMQWQWTLQCSPMQSNIGRSAQRSRYHLVFHPIKINLCSGRVSKLAPRDFLPSKKLRWSWQKNFDRVRHKATEGKSRPRSLDMDNLRVLDPGAALSGLAQRLYLTASIIAPLPINPPVLTSTKCSYPPRRRRKMSSGPSS